MRFLGNAVSNALGQPVSYASEDYRGKPMRKDTATGWASEILGHLIYAAKGYMDASWIAGGNPTITSVGNSMVARLMTGTYPIITPSEITSIYQSLGVTLRQGANLNPSFPLMGAAGNNGLGVGWGPGSALPSQPLCPGGAAYDANVGLCCVPGTVTGASGGEFKRCYSNDGRKILVSFAKFTWRWE